ncbi:MAG: hypothetical protein ACNA78_00230 [Balneolaceae bacterium]
MLETLYNNVGFVGSLVLSLGFFLFFIFWMSGVAGLCLDSKNDKISNAKLALAILVPIYPVAWIIVDMIRQKRELRRL